MSSRKWVKAAKEAGEDFSTATTITLFLFSALGMAVSIPLTVVFPVAGAAGLFFGFLGARRVLKKHREEKAKRLRALRERQLSNEAGHNISVLAHKLQHDLREIEAKHPVIFCKEIESKEKDEDCFDDRLPEEKYAYHAQPHFFAAEKPANDSVVPDEEKSERVLSL